MKTTTSMALSALFLNALVAAAPSRRHAHHAHLHEKRELVYTTEIVETTVYSTTTIWVGAGEAPTSVASAEAAPSSVGGLFYEQPSSKKSEAPYTPPAYTPPVAASSSFSSSVYVAPVPTSVYTPPAESTSVYVAPTSIYTPPAAPSPSSSSSSSVYVAPTSVYVAPTSAYVAPTSADVASTSAYVAPAAVSSTASTGGGAYGVSAGEKLTGDTTYYNPGGFTGACGTNIAESDAVVAISEDWFDLTTPNGNPNNNPICGQAIKITNTATGQTYDAKIEDRCTGCKGHDIDLPSLFFDKVFPGQAGAGRISGTGVFTYVFA